ISPQSFCTISFATWSNVAAAVQQDGPVVMTSRASVAISAMSPPSITAKAARRVPRRSSTLNGRYGIGEAMPPASFPIAPPVEPMLAKLTEELPADDGGFLFEPKWDGFRAIVFRGAGDVFIQSRDLRPLDRYFPELHDIFLARLPDGCVVDGEIVIATPGGLDFNALQMRLHPAASRVTKLSRESPAAFVAFDVLAAGGEDLRDTPQVDRRARL